MEEKRMIIGLIGKKQCGKSTFSMILRTDFGFREYMLAGPIKECVKTIFLWDDRHTEGELKEIVDERWGLSPREAMQHLGTEWGQIGLGDMYPKFRKATDRKLWISRFLHIMNSKPSVTKWVIPDVRFIHEAEELKKEGAILIKIVRPDPVKGAWDDHLSETEQESIIPDFTVENTGTLGDFIRYCKGLVDFIKWSKEGWKE